MKDWWLPLSYWKVWAAISAALVTMVVIGSLSPNGFPQVGSLDDKWQHATTYFVLSTWFTGLAHKRSWLWIAIALLGLGASLEVLQHFLTTHRVADPRDMVANTAGILSGMVAAYIGLGAWAQRVEAWLTKER